MNEAPNTAAGSGGAEISVAGARRTYELEDFSQLVALHDVDLEVASGSFVSVIGPSGCGKSTLLRAVGGLEPLDGGQVRVCGRTPSEVAASKGFGFVPQTPSLLPWLSVLKNVTLPSKVNRKHNRTPAPDMENLLRKAGLGDVVHELPGRLSGGMQQRAAIVRAFGLRPDVMLMDEPFSALDEFTRETLQGQLLELWEETRCTVLFVTHSIAEAVRLSDQIVVMAPKPGRVVDVIDVDLPRPRGTDLLKDPAFHAVEARVRDSLRAAFGEVPPPVTQRGRV